MSSEPEADLVGQRIARFQVLSRLGAGGMGVVYRALDTALRREIALKVLPPALTRDAERRMRFFREAQSAAAVAHSSIATVYEIGESEELVFIAMELVVGATLREVIDRGRMPIDEALRVARAMAAGLARAHRAGVVHRDLKPENVMLGAEGEVKILDFGIAKLREPGTLEAVALTEEGVVLGTPCYMAPEQACGEDVDARADVFALGIVLYEMLAGERPFRGETAMAVLTSILTDEPRPIAHVRPEAPLAISALVTRCLAKDPAHRPADAREVLAVLDPSAAASMPPLAADALAPTAPVVPPTRLAPPRRARLAGTTLAVVALLAVLAILALSARSAREGDLEIATPRLRERRMEDLRRISASPADATVDAPVLDAEGRRLAWVQGSGEVHLLDLESGERSTFDAGDPVRAVLFAGAGALELVVCPERCSLVRHDLRTGRRELVREDVYDAARSHDGTRVATRGADGIVRIGSSFEEPGVEITDVARGLGNVGQFDANGDLLVRNGRAIARVDRQGRVHVALDTPRNTTGGSFFAPLGPGRWLVALANWPPDVEGVSLWALDARLPPERALAEGVRILRLAPGLGLDNVSFAGRRIAFELAATQSDVWVAPIVGPGALGSPRRLTGDDRRDRGVAWLDARTVLFSSDRTGRWRAYAQAIDEREPRAIDTGEGSFTYPVRAAGGGVLAWRTAAPRPGGEVARVSLVHAPEDGAPREVVREPMDDAYYPVGLPGPRSFGVRCAAERCIVARSRGAVLELRELGADGALTARARAHIGDDAHALMWDLCPDGRRALVVSGSGVQEVDLETGAARPFASAAPYERVQYVGCSASGAWTTSHVAHGGARYELAHLDASGERRVVLESETDWLAQPVESPDGAHLAFVRVPHDDDVYVLELDELR